MNPKSDIALDHIFVLIPESNKQKAQQALLEAGFIEHGSRRHQGQGSENKLYRFANFTLELLWVYDSTEANTGSSAGLNLLQRSEDSKNSPFGLVFKRSQTQATKDMPFDGWAYPPDYFPPPNAFHVGENSADLTEPLCIYAPFMQKSNPDLRNNQDGFFSTLKKAVISVCSQSHSEVISVLNNMDGLSFELADENLLELVFKNKSSCQIKDLRPVLPLIIRY